MQKVVRTFPYNHTRAKSGLRELLLEGYKVVTCHVIDFDGKTCFEYTLEKDDDEK